MHDSPCARSSTSKSPSSSPLPRVRQNGAKPFAFGCVDSRSADLRGLAAALNSTASALPAASAGTLDGAESSRRTEQLPTQRMPGHCRRPPSAFRVASCSGSRDRHPPDPGNPCIAALPNPQMILLYAWQLPDFKRLWYRQVSSSQINVRSVRVGTFTTCAKSWDAEREIK
jgi:hypothetical protein